MSYDYFCDYTKIGSDDRQYEVGSNREGFLTNGKLCFRNMHCISGWSILCIKKDGRCGGALCNAAMSDKNIFEDNPFSDAEWIHAIVCPMQNCGCVTNHKIPKFLSKEEAKYFVECC